MAEQVTGVTKGITSAIRGVAIIYAMAILFTLLLLIVSDMYSGVFPSAVNPFPMIYNVVRNMTIFMLVFPPTFALIVGAWSLDTVLSIISPILNGVFEALTIPIALPETTDFLTAATDLSDTIQDLVLTLFPPLG